MNTHNRLLAAALVMALLLAGCRQPPAENPEEEPQPPQEETSAPSHTSITPEEGVLVLESLLGTEDEATGNLMSYGYEGTVTVDGTEYYNYRVSWLVDGDHLSYLTNYLVSTDGLVVQEYLPETD